MTDHPRILIVEDEPIVAADLRQTLVELGYTVVGIADTGDIAVDLARETRPDLVLMDIYLAGSAQGITAAGQINRNSRLPVIFLTANSNEDVMANARSAEPYGYLLKPYRVRELDATIRLALQQHQSVQSLFSRYHWLRTVLASLSDGVIATGIDGCIQHLNAAAEALTGWTQTEAVGRGVNEVLDLLATTGVPLPAEQWPVLLPPREIVGPKRYLLRTRYGATVPVEYSVAPILDAEGPIGAVSVLLDITDRLRREREVEALKDKLEDEVSRTTEALGETRAELRALSAHLMTAQEDERRWLARELHDDFGQRTAIIELQLARLSQMSTTNDPAFRELLLQVHHQVDALSTGLRTVSHRLHPSILADLGLIAALAALVEDCRDKGAEITAAFPDTVPELDLLKATALYRIAQEGLRNALKHAAGAPVHLRLSSASDAVQLNIDDAGPGFDVNLVKAHGGLGLVSIQERARLAGGTLSLAARPGEGTSLVIRIPIDPGPPDRQEIHE